ncbi:GntR family transcriptional regulator [Leifsonia sp. H3M29-4]|uniref:GntR family transcriptional regulator n=1 Tax=Salinibacterium metalliresistens TaxID=3031321 RepID=UPI0023DC2119|nr:GntR family transcriptional regulator [Salinibacterium metalliresistens]MDF1478318.1 GntR family transcriptional regulator [Salinibacterium metalliresistens]
MTSGTIIRQEAAPLRQRVVEIMRQEILDDVLHPGDRLLENTLCERYGVSRTVIREALRQLESERLITMLPNRGPIVTVLTVEDIEALYEVRRALEGLVGELFAERASQAQVAALREHFASMGDSYLRGTLESRGIAKDEFYRLLLDGAQNPVLTADLSGIHTRIGILRHYAFLDADRVALSMQELSRIVHAATELRDPVLARQACEEHIRGAGRLAILEYRKHVAANGTERDAS